jgi:hypothetical protein
MFPTCPVSACGVLALRELNATLVFRKIAIRRKLSGGRPVRAGRPRPAAGSAISAACKTRVGRRGVRRGLGGPPGVRPTIEQSTVPILSDQPLAPGHLRQAGDEPLQLPPRIAHSPAPAFKLRRCFGGRLFDLLVNVLGDILNAEVHGSIIALRSVAEGNFGAICSGVNFPDHGDRAASKRHFGRFPRQNSLE